MPLEELLTLHGKDEFAAGRDADRRTATSRHVVILLSWNFWTYLTHAGFVARGFGSDLIRSSGGSRACCYFGLIPIRRSALRFCHPRYVRFRSLGQLLTFVGYFSVFR